MPNKESGYPQPDSGENGEKLSLFLNELTRVETGLISNPSNTELRERERALWAGATDDDLRAWTSLLLRLTQDPTSQITTGFDDILKEAEQLRARAREGEPKGDTDVSRAGREEWDELKGKMGDERFVNWARDMEKRLGPGK